jgi:hypothetical protein
MTTWPTGGMTILLLEVDLNGLKEVDDVLLDRLNRIEPGQVPWARLQR